MSLTLWSDFRGQIAQLQAEAPELWQELEASNEALAETRSEGVGYSRQLTVLPLNTIPRRLLAHERLLALKQEYGV